jgi:hypothetical protein
MPNTKSIKQILNEVGATLYCIIRRDVDNYYMNDSNGSFALLPTDLYISLIENTVISGFYELHESRQVWNDGLYDIIIYKQLGGSPIPSNDEVVGGGMMEILSDEEVTESTETVVGTLPSQATSGASLSSLISGIQDVIQDLSFDEESIRRHINNAILNIAAGIRMPNGEISPPLPDLYQYRVVNTSSLSYVMLPSDYQRKIFNVCDATLYQILPPRGGDYYAFSKFLKQINKIDFSEQGEVYRLCIRGNKLFYQGIPSTPYPLGLHYYRKPAVLSLDGDIPEGIPEHLHHSIIKHYVCKDYFGEKIEDGQDNTAIGTKYHTGKFFEDMHYLIDFIGRDAEPMYYGEGGYEDRGSCDG